MPSDTLGMNAQQEAAISTLRHLIETARDGQEGFRNAAENIVDDPELRRLLSSFSLQRAKFAGELEAISITMGEHSPETGTSISGSLHRWWIDLRTAITKDDNHSILAECERGEDIAVHAYNTALEQDLPHPVKEIIIRQHREVTAAHNTIRALRDASPEAAHRLLTAARERADRAARESHLALEKAREKGHEWMHHMAEAVEDTSDHVSETSKEVERLSRRHPFLLLGGGLLAGLAMGLLFRAMERRRMSQKRLGWAQWRLGRKVSRKMNRQWRMGHWMGRMHEKAHQRASDLKNSWS